MANQEHLDLLKQGVDVWNKWRNGNTNILPDLSQANLKDANLRWADLREADLRGADLVEAKLVKADLRRAILRHAKLIRADIIEADLREVDLHGANLVEADLSEANLSGVKFFGANLIGANFSRANLREADLSGVDMRWGDLSRVDLIRADLHLANLREANLSYANLMGADLSRANLNNVILVETNLKEANLTGCSIYGISAWNVQLKDTKQSGLIITRDFEPTITVDDLEVAQFIYLLLNNKKIREVIDTVTSKMVLILGRFTDDRIAVLKALKDELLQHNYTPVLFDFDKPLSRDFTETVRTLAHLSRFILADITEPSSIPQELQAIIPDLEVPVQPLLLEAKREYSMFVDFRKYHWVLPVYLYKDQASLIASLKKEIIEPADKKARELVMEKAKRLERP